MASAVFNMLQVRGPGGVSCLPPSLCMSAVREMGYYPTNQFLLEALQEVSPGGPGSLTYAQFTQLCIRLEPTRQLDASAIARHVRSFDMHGNGVLSRAEFGTILTTVAAAAGGPSLSEVEAMADFLDPLHTNVIQIRALQTVMSRFLVDKQYAPSSIYTPCSHQWETARELSTDRHLLPCPLNMEPVDNSRGSLNKKNGRPSIEWRDNASRRRRRNSPFASAPEEMSSSRGEPSPGMPAPQTTAPSPYTSGNPTRAASLQQWQLDQQRQDQGRREEQERLENNDRSEEDTHWRENDHGEGNDQREQNREPIESKEQQLRRYSVEESSAVHRREPLALNVVRSSKTTQPPSLHLNKVNQSTSSPVASQTSHNSPPARTQHTLMRSEREVIAQQPQPSQVMSLDTIGTAETSPVQVNISESRVPRGSGRGNMLALPEVPLEELQDISIVESEVTESCRERNESPSIVIPLSESESERRYIPMNTGDFNRKKRKKVLQNCCNTM